MKEYYKNPRKITPKQLEQLKRNIQELGDLSGIVHDLNTDEIISGNQRSKVIDINKCEIVITEKYDTPNQQGTVAWGYVLFEGQKLNYRQVRWDERQREKANITANALGGDWDYDILEEQFNKEDLLNWGFEDIDIPIVETKQDVYEDEFSEEEAEKSKPLVQLGDIWQLGKHKLMCADSTIKENVAKLVDGKLCDLYLTDPPYNVSYVGKTSGLTIANDNQSDENFRAFLIAAFNSVNPFLKDGASFYIWHADLEWLNFRYSVKQAGWLYKQCLIWNKNSMVMGRQDYQWKHEPCLYGWKPGSAHKWYSDRKQTTVINFDKPIKNDIHPTMKPVGLFGYLIQNSTEHGNIVLDTFGGSGTSIIACEQLNRICYTMELDPRYCDAIIARWEKITGSKANKIKGIE